MVRCLHPVGRRLSVSWAEFELQALPSGDEVQGGLKPHCEFGRCYGICGGGMQDGRGPCRDLNYKSCCHAGQGGGGGGGGGGGRNGGGGGNVMGGSQIWLPSQPETRACICPPTSCEEPCALTGEPTVPAPATPPRGGVDGTAVPAKLLLLCVSRLILSTRHVISARAITCVSYHCAPLL
jgi:hypothetical protein